MLGLLFQAWVYQEPKKKPTRSATAPANPVSTQHHSMETEDHSNQAETPTDPSNKGTSCHGNQSGSRRKRRSRKQSRGYAFLNRIWKSVRRKIFIFETI